MSSRNALKKLAANVNESMGLRDTSQSPKLTPVVNPKDIGRTPSRQFGKLDLSQIVVDPLQPRTQFDEEDIRQLAQSFIETGQIQPIGVKWNESLEKWVVVTGERRFRAARFAGKTSINCEFVEMDLNAPQLLQRQLVENLLRKALAPLDEARGYQSLMEHMKLNGKEVAKYVGVSASRVSRSLALLDLPSDIQERIASGEISRSSAYELCKLDNESVQKNLADDLSTGEMTQRSAAKAVRQRKGKKKRESKTITRHFDCSHDIKISIQVPRDSTYHHVLEAGEDFLAEVELRIRANSQI